MLPFFVLQKREENGLKKRFVCMYQVTVQKGGQTVTAVFNEDIPAWPLGEWYSGKF